jgi:hypothetical protein
MVSRYELKADYDCGEMVPLIDGAYVLYSDYAKIEALIADAPHQSENCRVRWNHDSFKWEYGVCTCWKSRALDTGEKG